jgi:hypothetical protein
LPFHLTPEQGIEFYTKKTILAQGKSANFKWGGAEKTSEPNGLI